MGEWGEGEGARPLCTGNDACTLRETYARAQAPFCFKTCFALLGGRAWRRAKALHSHPGPDSLVFGACGGAPMTCFHTCVFFISEPAFHMAGSAAKRAATR